MTYPSLLSNLRPLWRLESNGLCRGIGPRQRCGHDEAPLREAPWLDAHGWSAVTRAATLHAVDGLTTSTALTVDTWRRGPEHLQRHYLLQHAPVVVTTIQQTPVASCTLSIGSWVSESLDMSTEWPALGRAVGQALFLPPSISLLWHTRLRGGRGATAGTPPLPHGLLHRMNENYVS